MQWASVTALPTANGAATQAANIGSPGRVAGPTAHGSRAGEDNSKHVALAFALIGVLAVFTGYLNIKVNAGG